MSHSEIKKELRELGLLDGSIFSSRFVNNIVKYIINKMGVLDVAKITGVYVPGYDGPNFEGINILPDLVADDLDKAIINGEQDGLVNFDDEHSSTQVFLIEEGFKFTPQFKKLWH